MTGTVYAVSVGRTLKQEEICIPGTWNVIKKPIHCECLTKQPQPAERGAAEDRNSWRTTGVSSFVLTDWIS